MGKITIDLIEEGKYRVLLMKLNKMQKKYNKPTFTLEEFVSMLLATPDIIDLIDFMSSIDYKALDKSISDIIKENK